MTSGFVDHSSSSDPARRVRWILAGILALAALLRFGALGQEPLWADEFHNAGLEPAWRAVLAASRDQGVQPPYFLLIHFWTKLAGSGDVALRVPSALFGTLSVLLMYWAGVGLFRRRGPALAAAALLAVSPMHIWYSQEARPYAMQVFFEIAALAALMTGMRNAECGMRNQEGSAFRIPHSASLFLSALLIILAVETHYFAIFAWAVFFAIYFLAAWPARLIRLPLALGLGAVMLAGAIHPLLGILDRLGPRRDLQSFLPASYGPSLMIDVLRAQLLGPHGSPLPLALQIIGIALGAVLMIRGGWVLLNRNEENKKNRIAGVVIVIGWMFTAAAPTAISFVRPIVYYGQRWLIIAIPFTALLLAAGVASGRGRPRSQAIRMAHLLACYFFLLLQLAWLPPYYLYRQKHPWDLVAERLLSESPGTHEFWVIPDRDAGLLARYLEQRKAWTHNVRGISADPGATLAALRQLHAPMHCYLICYSHMGPWLTAQRFPPVRTWLFETHQPGQTLWVYEIAGK